MHDDTKMPSPSVDHASSATIFTSHEITQLANSMISRFGRYHKLLLLLLCYHNLIVAINHTVTSFHTYTPKFYCRDNNDTTCKADQCHDGYEFDSEYETLVTEFSLVCSRRLLAPMINALYFVGVTAGAILCGTLADVWGRKLVVVTCLYVQGVLGASLYFVTNLDIFIVVRTIQGVFVQGLQGVSFALMFEHSSSGLRTGAACLYDVTWGIGLIFLAACSYLLPDWHNLQIGLTIPTLLTLLYVRFIPESISWLITHDKIELASRESIQIAKWNRDIKFFDEIQTIARKRSIWYPDDESIHEIPAAGTSIKDMLRNRILRKHTVVMVTVWFSVTLSYYGILYFLPSLAGERHLNFALGACIELISYGVSFITLSRYGRRWPMVIYQYLNGLFCLIIVMITVSVGSDGEIEGHWSRTLNTVMVLLAKGFTVSAFCGMYIYAAELFPTGCRAAALGLCGVFSRIGSLIAPQLLVLGDYTFEMFPVIIIGIAVLITGTATIFLPETHGILLPNSVDDVNKLWGAKTEPE